jgi:hypothetical protein
MCNASCQGIATASTVLPATVFDYLLAAVKTSRTHPWTPDPRTFSTFTHYIHSLHERMLTASKV